MKGKLDIDELEKLRDESIITEEQFQEICSRLQNSKDKNRDLLVNVLIGIGIFLVALGIISLFAYNWDNIPNIARVLIGLIPTFISIGLLYKYMDKKQTFYNVMVNVFSPFAFIATNAIISQTYHTQSTVFKIVIISLIMYIPIFILTKNMIGIIIYGLLGVFSAIGESAEEESAMIRIATHLLALLPLAYIGGKAYIENKNNVVSKLAYIFIAVLIISLLMFFDIVVAGNLILAIYIAYALVSLLFGEDKIIGRIMRGIFIAVYLFLSNIIISATLAIENDAVNIFVIDTVILLILSAVALITIRKYKFDNEMIIFICTLIIGVTPLIAVGLNIDIQDYRYSWEVIGNLSRNIGYMISALMAILGVSYIRVGYKKLKFTTTLLGIFIIIYEILSTFLTMDIDFMPKAIIFLTCGAAFIAGAIYFKKLTGGVQNEQ